MALKESSHMYSPYLSMPQCTYYRIQTVRTVQRSTIIHFFFFLSKVDHFVTFFYILGKYFL